MFMLLGFGNGGIGKGGETKHGSFTHEYGAQPCVDMCACAIDISLLHKVWRVATVSIPRQGP